MKELWEVFIEKAKKDPEAFLEFWGWMFAMLLLFLVVMTIIIFNIVMYATGAW